MTKPTLSVPLAELEELLSDLNFPTDREQILAFARDHKVPDSALNTLDMLPDVIFHRVDDITQALEGVDPAQPRALDDDVDTGPGSSPLSDGYEGDQKFNSDDEQEIDTTYDTDEPEETHG